MSEVSDTPKKPHERRGCVEIRWAGNDPDDVVAPWPREHEDEPITVHVERMSDESVWMAIYPAGPDDERVCMWFNARKGKLEWTVSERGS